MKTVSTGIRQKQNGKFLATKSIKGKRYYEEFDRLTDAKRWRKEFHPLLSMNRKQGTRSLRNFSPDFINGKDQIVDLADVIEMYQREFLPSLSEYTREKKMRRLSNFLPNIINTPMHLFCPELIAEHLNKLKETLDPKSRRCNFNKELKELSSIFNWYKNYKDFTFVNPVTSLHGKIGKISEVPKKPKILTESELLSFLDHLPSGMFRSMAKLMYLWALRVGEAAALDDESINLQSMECRINKTVVWMKGGPRIKPSTKTGDDSVLPIDEIILEEIKELIRSRPKGCNLLFHYKGRLLSHERIRLVFNKALESAGLPHRGTHILRHSMATHARRKMGLDASQAILRHTTIRMSEHYSKLDVNEKVTGIVIEASNLFRKSQVGATSCDQSTINA